MHGQGKLPKQVCCKNQGCETSWIPRQSYTSIKYQLYHSIIDVCHCCIGLCCVLKLLFYYFMWILLYDWHSFGDFVHVLWFCGIWLDWSSVAYVTIWMYNKLQITNYNLQFCVKYVFRLMRYSLLLCVKPVTVLFKYVLLWGTSL